MKTMGGMAITNTAPPPFLRFREVCELLGMSTDTGYAHVRAGTFPVPILKVGGILKARRADVERFLAGDDP